MQHKDHVNLIQDAITEKTGTWADFGSGDGAFTQALRDIAGEGIEIYSVDLNKDRLINQQFQFKNSFPNTNIQYINKDFTKDLELPSLDGILMANSLHYIKDKISLLQLMNKYLKDKGKLVIVEYNTDNANPWIPFPLSYKTFELLIEKTNFNNAQLLYTIHSDWLNEIYSAQAIFDIKS